MFGMVQHHGWSLEELENLMPWERDVYAALLKQHLEDEKMRHEQQQRKMRS